MYKLYIAILVFLISTEPVLSRRFPRNKAEDGPLSEVQIGLLEEIQVLAKKAGLPESEWENITKYDKDVCYEIDCLESAIEVMTATNFTVDPCDPKMWLEFACARRVNGPDNINQLERLQKNVQKQTLSILDDDTGKYEDEFLWKEARTYYHQCKHKSHADDQDVIDIMKYSEKYGNWPILTNREPGEKFNWLEMVADLNRVERGGFNPYLLAVKVPDFTEKQGPIELNVGRTVIPTSSSDLQNMLSLIQKKIGQEKPVRVDQVASMVLFMATVSGATIAKDRSKLISIEALQNQTDEHLKKLETKMPVDWLDFFKRVFNGVESINVTPQLNVSVPFTKIMGVLRAVNLYISSKEKKSRWAVANALQFQLVSTLLQESTSFLDNMNTFRCLEQTGDRNAICFIRTKEMFGYSLGSTYVKTYYDEENTTPAVNKLTEGIKRGYINIISKTKWMENSTKEFLTDKIQSIHTFIAYPEWLTNSSKLKEFFKALDMPTSENSSYPINYLTMNTWRLQKKRSWAYKYLNLTSWKGFSLYDIEWNHYPATVQAQYHKAINEARIEAGVIQKPIFGKDRPGFMNHGGLGMILAHEFGHSFDIIGRMFNKHGENKKEYWDIPSVKKYLKWVQQIAEQYGSEPYRLTETSSETIDPWKTINEDISDILAVYISYHSYQLYLRDLRKAGQSEKVIPGLKSYSPQKLFYMKYANMWCDNKDLQSKFKDLLSDHSSGRTRATLPLKYSKQFARAFGCDIPKD